jgi:hypothetical protein
MFPGRNKIIASSSYGYTALCIGKSFIAILYCTSIYVLGTYRVSQKWRTNYLVPYRGCLNVHEKNMKNFFPTKKSIIFIIIINDNTM